MTPRPGVFLNETGTRFVVHAPDTSNVLLCLFEGGVEQCLAMTRIGSSYAIEIAGVGVGQRYGYRAEGRYAPDEGLWCDRSKLLVDPYAVALDRSFTYDVRLGQFGIETAALVPKAIVTAPLPARPAQPPNFAPGGLIYEVNVRGYTLLHPDVPPALRGTVAALAHPAVIAHLQKIGVNAVELMPIVAWIDERHLPPLGLRNIWGYNPVVPMALDPQLAPGGIGELRATVEALHAAGIGVILDLVFNHSGESDAEGPTLAFRGLDNHGYYRHESNGTLVNVTGCGNTLNCAADIMQALILDTLRHFAREAGIDGFRFDLAPVLARTPDFDRHAAIFDALASDPFLHDRIMIAEPWDIGGGGYQLGNFPDDWLEWNDKYRDDIRRFWRGDGLPADLATRLAGSSDIFGETKSRTVNFIAAHDGFSFADLVGYAERHNLANGEDNRDGHGENLSWNCGVEGESADPNVTRHRARDVRALLATLFVSRGTIMLTAGDEFGRTQRGNNNAYAQDNAISWIDWAGRDVALEDYVSGLAQLRRALPALSDPKQRHDTEWFTLDGAPMTPAEWNNAQSNGFEMSLPLPDNGRFTCRFDRVARTVSFTQP